MRILVTCEESGAVRRAFAARGDRVWSCDLMPARDGERVMHLQVDALAAIAAGCPDGGAWDMLIGFPPCTYLSVSGIHWNSRGRGWERTEAAVAFFRAHWESGIARIALENPVGILSRRIRRPDQIIQPYQFGDDASKKTCLWLRGLPRLRNKPADRKAGRWVEWPRGSGRMVERWSNQTDSGQNRLAPSAGRAAERAVTYPRIARAMAEQWGGPDVRSETLFDV